MRCLSLLANAWARVETDTRVHAKRLKRGDKSAVQLRHGLLFSGVTRLLAAGL